MLQAHPDVLMHTHLAETCTSWPRWRPCSPGPRTTSTSMTASASSARARCSPTPSTWTRPPWTASARAGAAVAFCPSSNLFLGSGLFDLKLADRCGVKVGIGTDVGAGTSFSVLQTLGEAYKVCQLRGANLDPLRALYMATAGGARALGIHARVGALDVGQEADFVVLDPAATPLLARRTAGADMADVLFALQILGDDRAVKSTYIKGRLAHARDGTRDDAE
ncbi:MAG: amidohydrolase family protein [Caulobacteraceae bacterium]